MRCAKRATPSVPMGLGGAQGRLDPRWLKSMEMLAHTFLAAAALLVLGLSSISCAAGERRFTVNEAIYVDAGATLIRQGGGCTNITLPASGAEDSVGSRIGDFSVAEGPDGDAYLVRVFSDQELVTSRRYDEAMLASGSIDEFSVTTHLGAVHTLRYWGGPCGLGADGSTE